jgi:ubiquitin-conjugating enzyme E2 D/E
MSTGIKRLNVEFNALMKQEEKAKADGVEQMFRVWQKDGKITHWYAKIRGAHDTILEGGIFLLDITFPERYPFSPPTVTFKTKTYHPNITDNCVCLDILKPGKWSAALKVEKVLLSIISFLTDPNPNDPLNSNVASVYRTDKAAYERTVIEYKEKYCCKSWDGEN